METIFDLKSIEEKVIVNLKNVFDPEIPTNIYDLGLIYNIEFEQKEQYLYCTITMTLTSPTCPVAESLLEQVKYVSLAVDEIDEAKVTLVFSPPWDPSMMSEDAREVMGASGAAMPF
jgi:metal-sulfur cluster biosynthetic enzyme